MSTATGAGHETRDLLLRPIIVFGLALVLLIGLAFLFMRDLFGDFQAARQRAESAPVPIAVSELPPEPRLQVNPASDLSALRAREDRLLDGYQWIDRQQRIVRIPIEQAMRRVAVPTRPEGSAKEDP